MPTAAVAAPETLVAAVERDRIKAQILHLRALARSAARDGAPMATLRVANARAATRSLLRHARRSADQARPEPAATS